MKLADFFAHLNTHFGIEVGKGLIEQEQAGVADDGAAARLEGREYYDWVTAAGIRVPVDIGDSFSLCSGADEVTFDVISAGTDGTAAGTGLARDVTPGSQGSSRTQTFATEEQLFFLVDDLGQRDVACYGSQFYETPAIDQLAKEGILDE